MELLAGVAADLDDAVAKVSVHTEGDGGEGKGTPIQERVEPWPVVEPLHKREEPDPAKKGEQQVTVGEGDKKAGKHRDDKRKSR